MIKQDFKVTALLNLNKNANTSVTNNIYTDSMDSRVIYTKDSFSDLIILNDRLTPVIEQMIKDFVDVSDKEELDIKPSILFKISNEEHEKEDLYSKVNENFKPNIQIVTTPNGTYKFIPFIIDNICYTTVEINKVKKGDTLKDTLYLLMEDITRDFAELTEQVLDLWIKFNRMYTELTDRNTKQYTSLFDIDADIIMHKRHIDHIKERLDNMHWIGYDYEQNVIDLRAYGSSQFFTLDLEPLNDEYCRFLPFCITEESEFGGCFIEMVGQAIMSVTKSFGTFNIIPDPDYIQRRTSRKIVLRGSHLYIIFRMKDFTKDCNVINEIYNYDNDMLHDDQTGFDNYTWDYSRNEGDMHLLAKDSNESIKVSIDHSDYEARFNYTLNAFMHAEFWIDPFPEVDVFVYNEEIANVEMKVTNNMFVGSSVVPEIDIMSELDTDPPSIIAEPEIVIYNDATFPYQLPVYTQGGFGSDLVVTGTVKRGTAIFDLEDISPYPLTVNGDDVIINTMYSYEIFNLTFNYEGVTATSEIRMRDKPVISITEDVLEVGFGYSDTINYNVTGHYSQSDIVLNAVNTSNNESASSYFTIDTFGIITIADNTPIGDYRITLNCLDSNDSCEVKVYRTPEVFIKRMIDGVLVDVSETSLRKKDLPLELYYGYEYGIPGREMFVHNYSSNNIFDYNVSISVDAHDRIITYTSKNDSVTNDYTNTVDISVRGTNSTGNGTLNTKRHTYKLIGDPRIWIVGNTEEIINVGDVDESETFEISYGDRNAVTLTGIDTTYYTITQPIESSNQGTILISKDIPPGTYECILSYEDYELPIVIVNEESDTKKSNMTYTKSSASTSGSIESTSSENDDIAYVYCYYKHHDPLFGDAAVYRSRVIMKERITDTVEMSDDTGQFRATTLTYVGASSSYPGYHVYENNSYCSFNYDMSGYFTSSSMTVKFI